jgi:hypothetical protein
VFKIFEFFRFNLLHLRINVVHGNFYLEVNSQ